ncbi:uncharacterized protein K02A2.6-like [Leptopilina boulardi]|uniref:uncharacterized protein K02A2.6-like n=1 Tax=Leptopilina boulardi TaxID=63433 RepID=UPI0021F5631B|nr:uncharacterized protein K02A2.6-like [Leptopilina boulardi]
MGQRIVERPWSVVAADTMEFPSSKSRCRYLVVFQDLFSRWVELKPLRSADGKSVTGAFEELILFQWETPNFLLTDNGKEFDLLYLKDAFQEYGMKHITTPPYHPQANPVQRSNRTLKTMLSAFIRSDHRDWDLHVHEFRHAMNTATQATTKSSPAYLNYGRNPRLIKSLRREVEAKDKVVLIKPEEWVDRVKRLDALRDMVKKFIDRERDRQSGYYNRNRKDVPFKVGDLVLRKTHKLSSGNRNFATKLAPKYEGRFEIVEQLSPTVFVLLTSDSRRIPKVHVTDLKKYLPPGNCLIPY